jgi:hypothetical protein
MTANAYPLEVLASHYFFRLHALVVHQQNYGAIFH